MKTTRRGFLKVLGIGAGATVVAVPALSLEGETSQEPLGHQDLGSAIYNITPADSPLLDLYQSNFGTLKIARKP